MKGKYIEAFIFLILLILTYISQYDVAFPVVPGWHVIVYPPEYIIEMTIIFLSLSIAIIGYTILTFKKTPLNIKVFAIHLLLTIPTIIALFFPFNNVDASSFSSEEIEKSLSLKDWVEYIVITLFLAGQIIFFTFFIKHVRQSSKVRK